jgi:hypothetical protein
VVAVIPPVVAVVTAVAVAVATRAVTVVAVVTSMDCFAVAVGMTMAMAVGTRHDRQQCKDEGCRERCEESAASRCVSVTQEIPPDSVIGRGRLSSARYTVRQTNIRTSI